MYIIQGMCMWNDAKPSIIVHKDKCDEKEKEIFNITKKRAKIREMTSFYHS